jgi:protein gp37
VMHDASWHTFQILTKRADRLSLFSRTRAQRLGRPIDPHVWLGVSVEDRKYGVPRIAELRQADAAVRFLSIEPLLEDLGELDLRCIDWVIVGGESGPGARPMQADWVRSLRDQCAAQGVAFFFKQWGGLKKKVAGRVLDGRTHDEMPQRSTAAVPPARARAELLRITRAVAHRYGELFT